MGLSACCPLLLQACTVPARLHSAISLAVRRPLLLDVPARGLPTGTPGSVAAQHRVCDGAVQPCASDRAQHAARQFRYDT